MSPFFAYWIINHSIRENEGGTVSSSKECYEDLSEFCFLLYWASNYLCK